MNKNLIIIALLTTNIVFAWYLWQLPTTDKPPEPGARTVPEIPAAPERPPATAVRQSVDAAPARAATTIDLDDSHEDLSAQLREQGFDETLVRQIVFANIKRQRLLLEQLRPEDYWRRPEVSPTEDLQKELNWDAEQRQLLLDLFGENIRNDPMFSDLFRPLNSTLPFLSSEKQIALDEMNQRQRAAREEMFQGGPIRENSQDLRETFEMYQERIRQMMTEDEYFEYQLRRSPLAYTMRRDLGEVINTEQEFRDLFEIRRDDTTPMSRRGFARESDPVVEEQVRTYLGSDRYAEYERASDPRYRILRSIGERYDNSESDIIRVYEEITALAGEVREIRADSALSQTEQDEKIEALRAEGYQKIERISGTETADSIKQNSRRLGLSGRSGRGPP